MRNSLGLLISKPLIRIINTSGMVKVISVIHEYIYLTGQHWFNKSLRQERIFFLKFSKSCHMIGNSVLLLFKRPFPSLALCKNPK